MDELEDDATRRYGLWPERYLLIEGQHVCWASSLGLEERCAKIPETLCKAAAAIW